MTKLILRGVFIVVAAVGLVTTSAKAQAPTSAVTTDMLENFENEGAWNIQFSSFKCAAWTKPISDPKGGNGGGQQAPAATDGQQPAAAQPAPQNNNAQQSSSDWIKWIKVEEYPEMLRVKMTPFGLPNDKRATEKSFLGIKGCWDAPGYNWLSVSPKQKLYTPENPVTISLWAWGEGYNYDLYIVVKNTDGYYHNLYLGNLAFYGWRNLRINIPGFVYPKSKHATSTKLEVVRLQVVTRPTEDPDGFYAYFDFMQVDHSTSQVSFDGNGLNEVQW